MASSTPTQSPNLHPNAIKTTSTGVLTRSNSSKAHGSWASHKYVPVPSPSAFVFDSPTSSPSPRHRHMKSSSDAQKSPSNKSYRLESAQRSERSYSMSPSPTKYSRSWVGKDPQGEQIKLPVSGRAALAALSNKHLKCLIETPIFMDSCTFSHISIL